MKNHTESLAKWTQQEDSITTTTTTVISIKNWTKPTKKLQHSEARTAIHVCEKVKLKTMLEKALNNRLFLTHTLSPGRSLYLLLLLVCDNPHEYEQHINNVQRYQCMYSHMWRSGACMCVFA